MPEIALSALTPLDGRYSGLLRPLSKIFSEESLIFHRCLVELRWFQYLSKETTLPAFPALSKEGLSYIDTLLANFKVEDAAKVKVIEATTNHDVKAVEYYLKNQLESNNELKPYLEWIHFSCTSEDINNLAYGLMIQKSLKEVILPVIDEVMVLLKQMALDFSSIGMLSRTHGQPATPTTLGKEFANFYMRLKKMVITLKSFQMTGKLNGAVGNYNAHVLAFPEVDWIGLSESFVESLGLLWNGYTTQIEPHDSLAQLAHLFVRFNTICLDLAKDMWGYISIGYFNQRLKVGEVGSSTMPHKINPIDFENAEGNLGLANTLFNHMAEKLPVSRWQRDLSDSTVMRSLGTAFGHTLIAYKAIKKGLRKLEVNEKILEADLESHWEVLAEPLQTVLRAFGSSSAPYEQLKALTRGQSFTKADYLAFVQGLVLDEKLKERLLALTPQTYIGLAEVLAKRIE